MKMPLGARGFTLVELAIGIAIMAVLATITLPSFAERIARARLAGAAETLASDLAEARFEAAQSGRPLYVLFEPGADWCYAVARTPDCGCRQAQACQLKVARASDVPGVTLVEATDARFEPATGDLPGGEARWRGLQGAQSLQVTLTPLGRAKICTPTGLKGYAGC